jgi:hypothetical protein
MLKDKVYKGEEIIDIDLVKYVHTYFTQEDIN